MDISDVEEINPFSEEARGSKSPTPPPPPPLPLQPSAAALQKSPLSQVDELLQKIEDESLRKLFKDDILEIQQCIAALKAIQLLQQEMSSEKSVSLGCFDEEDWKRVSEKRKALENEITLRQTRVLRSIQEYDDKILHIVRTLEMRTNIIDAVQEKSGLFTNPLTSDIADFFLEKHEKLERVTAQVKENMRQIMSVTIRENHANGASGGGNSGASGGSGSGASGGSVSQKVSKSLLQSFQSLVSAPKQQPQKNSSSAPKKPKKPRNYRDNDDSDDDF